MAGIAAAEVEPLALMIAKVDTYCRKHNYWEAHPEAALITETHFRLLLAEAKEHLDNERLVAVLSVCAELYGFPFPANRWIAVLMSVRGLMRRDRVGPFAERPVGDWVPDGAHRGLWDKIL